MYVYESFEEGLYTVGHYDPNGNFKPESDHENKDDAARRVAWLNGNRDAELIYKRCTTPPKPRGFIIPGDIDAANAEVGK